MRLWRNGNGKRVCVLLAALATLGGCSSGNGPGQVVDSALDPMFPPTPSEAARDAFNVYDADKRRRAVNLLSTADFGGEAEYLRTYRLLVDDKDPTVRAACIRALGQHGTPTDVNRVLPYLEDPNVFVRVEAARALQRLHNEEAIDPLLTALRDDTASEVRLECANALGQYPRGRVFQALVGALNDDDYAVIRQAVESLRTLTGQKFGEDGSRWLAWADEQEDLFADKQPYYYPQYDAPPSFWDKLAFWSSGDSAEPQRPRGLGGASADQPGDAAPPASGSSDGGAVSTGDAGSREAAPEAMKGPEPTATADPEEDAGEESASGAEDGQTARADGKPNRNAEEGEGAEEDDAEAWRKAHPLGATDGK